VRTWFPEARYRRLFLDGLSRAEGQGSPQSPALGRAR